MNNTMNNAQPERRGSYLAPFTWTLLAAFGAAGCVGSSYSMFESTEYDLPETADLAVEIGALVDELTELAGLRIPLGSVRVIIDEPVPIRPKSARFRPAAQGERDRRATQAAVRFELEMALGNRMNVVGAGDLSSGSLEGAATEASSNERPTLAQRAARTRATHALLATFVRDGDDLDLSIRLVEFDSEWIIATARRKIVGFVPDAYDEQYGAPVPVSTSATDLKRTAEIEPSASDSIGALDGTGEKTPASASGAGLTGAAGGDARSRAASGLGPAVDFDAGPAASRLRALERLKTPAATKTSAKKTKSQY